MEDGHEPRAQTSHALPHFGISTESARTRDDERIDIALQILRTRGTLAEILKHANIQTEGPAANFFYGYESRRQPARASAAFLYQLCDPLLMSPGDYLAGHGVRRGAQFAHRRVIFVAHSPGAPLVRAMLLRAKEANAPWRNRRLN